MVSTMGLKVGVIGYGVVGAATARKLHKLGNDVYVHDIRPPEALEGWDNGLNFREEYSLRETAATFLALPTPSKEEKLYRSLSEDERAHTIEGRFGESLDTTLTDTVVESMARKLASELRRQDDYHLFVVRSTVEPGTTRRLGNLIAEISGKKAYQEFGMGMVPEFLRAYNSHADEDNAPLIVLGHSDEKALELLRRIYQNVPLNETGGSRLYPVSLEEAELVKLESNAINAIWISLQNSRSLFYQLLGRNVGINVDYERMTKVLTTMTEAFTNPTYGTTPGIFYGGTCLKKDPTALHSWATDQHELGCHYMAFLAAAILTNMHLQKVTLNDHRFDPALLRNGIPERLRRRHHSSYDNITKITRALVEALEPSPSQRFSSRKKKERTLPKVRLRRRSSDRDATK